MTIRSSHEARQHIVLIETLVESLQQRGYESIRAEHITGFEGLRPEPIYSDEHSHFFTPDVVAQKDDRQVLFEVETAGSLDAPSAQAELKTFAVYAAENDMLYYLVVPDEIRKKGRVPKNGNIFFTIFQTFMSGTDAEGNSTPYFGDYPAFCVG